MARTCEELQAEIDQLRQRVAELERERDEARDDRQWMEDLLDQSNIPICFWRGDTLIYTFANTAYRQRTGKFDAIGKPLREVFEEHEVPGLMDLVEHAYTSGEQQVIPEARVSFENPETGLPEDSWHNLLHNPVRNTEGDVIGVSLFAVEVTEQVRARQELYQQAQILNQVRGSVIVTDMQGTIISWNRDSTRIYGYTPEEIIGQPIAQLYPPEEQERLINEVIIPLQEQGELEIETTTYNKNGNTFPVQLSLSLLRDDSGTPVGMIGYSIDITERKQQEQDLRVLFDNVNDGIVIHALDDTGTILEVNEQMMAMYQVDRATALSLNISDFSSPRNNRDAIGQMLQRAIDGEHPVFSWKARRPGDGSEFDAEVTLRRVNFQQKVCILATTRDITEQKRQQAEVSIFKTMADTAPDGFGMANADGMLIYANAAYRNLTGYGDALIGMNFLDHFTEADRVLALEALTTTAEQGDWQGVLNFQQQDGRIIPVDTKGFVTRDEKGTIIAIMGLFRDLSEQHRQEAERAALQQQIIDAQREALRELSAPLLPISVGVVIMPLIGTIDSQRAQQVMETLLDGVANHRADTAIVDITGVQVVDTQVANALMQAAQAVRLLGAQVVLTGIGPVMAQTLIHLGVDLSGIITQGNLQGGIAYALRTSRGNGLNNGG
jgi:PAS domain S-box-containing protein